MEMLKIEELKKELKIGEIGDRFCDYDNGYICDIISEIADSACDLYTGDLLDWAKNNINYIEDALDELGTPTNSRGQADFLKMAQQGQYLYYEEDLNENLEDILKNWALNYIKSTLKKDEISDDQWDEITGNIDITESDEDLQDFADEINEILK